MAAAKRMTIGKLVDLLYQKREARLALESQAKKIEEEERELKNQILERAEREDTTAGRGTTASFTINEQVSPQVTDWDKFYQYIHDNSFYHLLHRRASTDGCKEIFDKGETIPGVDKFTKKVVNTRKV